MKVTFALFGHIGSAELNNTLSFIHSRARNDVFKTKIAHTADKIYIPF